MPGRYTIHAACFLPARRDGGLAITTARKLLTADDLLAIPRGDGYRHELVRGELVTMPPPGFMHSLVTGNFGFRITSFVHKNDLPYVGGPEASAFIEQNPDTVRAADYAICPLQYPPGPLPYRGYVPGLVPVLVVEVISPGYRSAAGVAERVHMWQEAGVHLVVIAHIATHEIVTHRNDGTEHTFTVGDTLTLEPVLPGFTCPVADVFAV